jgi:large subunit ribosomal protein L19
MNNLLKEFENTFPKKVVADFSVGDTVRVSVRIKEGDKSRLQVFEGTVISKRNDNFTVRKISHGVGVERVFPVYSPNVENIEVSYSGKVRRAKLYYIRNKIGKDAKIKEAL